MKVPFKATRLKPKVGILYYLLTRILFPMIINHGYVVRKDVVSLWLLTQEIPTNWVELTYGLMITQLLTTINIDTMDETEDSTNHRITYNALKEIRAQIKHGKIEED